MPNFTDEVTTSEDLQQQQQQQHQQQHHRLQSSGHHQHHQVVFVSGNQGKLEDFRALLADRQSISGRFAIRDLDLVELQGTHEEIATAKCRRAAELLRCPVLIEDTSLELVALNGLPGPYIKWFWKALRNEHLPSLLAAFDDKSAVARSIVAYCPGPGAEVRLFVGECRGSLLEKPRGPPVHGWLPLFVPEGLDRSLAEMEAAERYRYHHRAKALVSFFDFYADGVSVASMNAQG